MELQIKNRIPPEITDFVVSGFLMKVEIYQLINDIYSAQAMISKPTRSFERIVSGGVFTPREDHILEVFPSTGGFLILVEDLLVSHPRYYELMNKLISMGRNFLSFIEIAAGAIDPVAFDQELDFQSATAAVDCFDIFKIESQISI